MAEKLVTRGSEFKLTVLGLLSEMGRTTEALALLSWQRT